MIHFYKFRKEKNYADFFADKMYNCIIQNFPDTDFDFISFIPMTAESEKKRGFNQSKLLSVKLSKRLFVPCVPLFTKTKQTKTQHLLPSDKRRENLKNAFALTQTVDVKGKTILLCDDIKTTGTTLLACEKILIQAGAADVYCAVIAIPVYIEKSIDKEK